MTDPLHNKDISNEQVIDELTRNLEFSLRPEDEDNVIEPDTSTDDCFESGADGDGLRGSQSTSNAFNEEADKTERLEQSDQEESDTDSIDELSLKDMEVDLTDDEKAERRTTAEELKNAGNNAFKVEDYELSIDKYTEGLRICPLQFSNVRAILYCNRSAAKMKLKRYKQAIKDCTKAIDLEETYLKAFYRRAQCYEAIDKLDECLEDYKKILELDPSHKEAQSALFRLPPLIEERNEKLKTEMLGKLKDLGNMILKPFGLSTENFKMEQDPETKGYKINFKQ